MIRSLLARLTSLMNMDMKLKFKDPVDWSTRQRNLYRVVQSSGSRQTAMWLLYK